MNKKDYLCLRRYAKEHSPITMQEIGRYMGHPVMGCYHFVVCFHENVELPEPVLDMLTPYHDVIDKQLLTVFYNDDKAFYLTAADCKCPLNTEDGGVFEPLGGYTVDKQMLYRIARVIRLHTVKLPDDYRRPWKLMGKDGVAYILPKIRKRGI